MSARGRAASEEASSYLGLEVLVGPTFSERHGYCGVAIVASPNQRRLPILTHHTDLRGGAGLIFERERRMGEGKRQENGEGEKD